MDFFKPITNLFSGIKNYFTGGGGQAAIGGFQEPGTVQVPTIQQPGQFSIPSQTGASTPAIIGTKSGIGQPLTYSAKDFYPGTNIIKPGAQPISTTTPIGNIRPLITTPIQTVQPAPIAPTAPTAPTAPPTGFATGEPTITEPALAGISTPSGLSAPSAPSGAPSAPSGASSGFFAGFSPTALSSFARSIGVLPNRINQQTGEIINPTEEELRKFKERFAFRLGEQKSKAVDVTQVATEPFKVEPVARPISADQLGGEKEELFKTAQDDQRGLQVKIQQAYDAAPPVPAQPVVETPEQQEAVKNSADPYGLQAAMDASRAKNGIP